MARRLSTPGTGNRTPPGRQLHVQRLVALAVLGVVLFDFPVLTLWVPRPLALFVVWALFVAALAWLLETAGRSGPGRRPDPGQD
jgi:hypothetical protein